MSRNILCLTMWKRHLRACFPVVLASCHSDMNVGAFEDYLEMRREMRVTYTVWENEGGTSLTASEE